jgi:hypothetical protein
MKLSDADRKKLEELRFDPKAEPSFNLMKSCLVWPDELAEGLSRDGYELLGDLWIVRGFFHRGVPREQWGLDPAYFEGVWAENETVKWPGFLRLQLSDRDKKYLADSLAEAATATDY